MLQWFNSAYQDAFLIKLINMSITASVIIIVLLGIRFLFRRAPKIFSYALWGIVLFRLLCPISFSTKFSAFSLLFMSENNAEQVQEILQPSAMNGYIASGENIDKPFLDKQNNHSIFQQMKRTIFLTDAIETVENHGNLQISEETKDGYEGLFTLYAIWGMGIAILVGINMIAVWRLRRKTAASIQLQSQVFLCDNVDVPFCLGVFRPRIYLPSSLNEQEREYIILHEKQHIKRLDHVIKLLAYFALCLHWFNPFVWLAFILAGKDMEMSCDEAVLKQMDEDIRADYSVSLLHLATGKRVFVGTGLAFGAGNPKQRIKNIMNYKKPSFWIVISAMIGCAGIAIALMSNPKEPQQDTSDEISSAVGQPIWKTVGDVGGDERLDYVIMTGMDGYYNHLALYLTGEGIIFEHEDSNFIEVDEVHSVDIDHDEEDEILITMLPHVNSCPLIEYAVLKKAGDAWKKLQIYHAEEDIASNSFPLSITRGKDTFVAELTCKGLNKTVCFDLKPYYDYWKTLEEQPLKQQLIDYYEKEIKKSETGQAIGRVSAWGIWEIQLADFEGQTCLIAIQGIEGYDNHDIWGKAQIYFDYDETGKIRVLDLHFLPELGL